MPEDGPKPSRGRPRKVSSDTVVDVAMAAFWKEDPADVSVNAICQMAGVSKPSLYRTFGSEDGLTCAVLDRYADKVLADVLAILQGGSDMKTTLGALIDLACDDPRMESGCLFSKMRAGKHRLGPKTRKRMDALEAAAIAGYTDFLQSRRDAGDWPGALPLDQAAQYLSEQISLAYTQRATGVEPERIRSMLALALMVFDQSRTEGPV